MNMAKANRKHNVRPATNNTTGLPGVNWYRNYAKWCAAIGVGGVKHLGYFDSFFEACCARKSAENKYNFGAKG